MGTGWQAAGSCSTIDSKSLVTVEHVLWKPLMRVFWKWTTALQFIADTWRRNLFYRRARTYVSCNDSQMLAKETPMRKSVSREVRAGKNTRALAWQMAASYAQFLTISLVKRGGLACHSAGNQPEIDSIRRPRSRENYNRANRRIHNRETRESPDSRRLWLWLALNYELLKIALNETIDTSWWICIPHHKGVVRGNSWPTNDLLKLLRINYYRIMNFVERNIFGMKKTMRTNGVIVPSILQSTER